MNAIEIKNLTKVFSNKTAVNGLNMTVPVGSIYGFIGENGSGKSTTEKMICGLLTITSGSIKLFGQSYLNDDIKDKIGVLIESPGCFPNLTVWNNMKIQANNLGIKNPDKQIKEILQIVHMQGAASNKYKNCSLGMKQRIGIAMALLGSPKILILDEPINGLDIDGVRIIREILLDLSSNGITILISSHILAELEKIATHYGIIRNGKMIKEMTSSELDKECPSYVEIDTEDNDYTEQVLNKFFNRVVIAEEKVRIYDQTTAEDVVKYLFENHIYITEITTKKISLEEYYINLMGGNNHE